MAALRVVGLDLRAAGRPIIAAVGVNMPREVRSNIAGDHARLDHTVRVIRRWSTATTVAVVVSLIAACSSSSKPHGNPDPGGARLAALAQVATAVMPTHATPIHLTLSPSKWSHGGCDGGPAGWTNMEAVQTFAATGNVVADIDANMKRLHWSIVPQGGSGGSRSSQYPPSAAPGANAPYAREYEQSASADDPAAWLFTPNQTGRSYWEIDLVRPPAELRAADC